MDKSDQEKLEILLHHWVEHNREHGQEFKRWAGRANRLGLKVVGDEILNAAGRMDQANEHLTRASERLRNERQAP